MTEKPDIADQVRNIIAEQIGREISEVVDTAKLRDDLGADSLDEVGFSISLEEEFNIEISDNEMFEFESATVGDVVKLVTERVKA